MDRLIFFTVTIGNGTIKTTTGSGGFGINTGYNVNPRCALEVNGIGLLRSGALYIFFLRNLRHLYPAFSKKIPRLASSISFSPKF
jgi:hypothetical protein